MRFLLLSAAVALAGPHEEHERLQLGAREASLEEALRDGPIPLPAVTPGPDRIVYGYQAYWNADLQDVPWDDISHLAIFSADAETNGSLTNTSRLDIATEAVQIASAYGVKVHLVVTNFSSSELTTLLSSASARGTLIQNIVAQVNRTGAHGVNIDFENLPSSQRQNMITFVQALDAAVDEVVLATPSVDWSGAWDYDVLAQSAHLFIMGYGYHWSGSDYAGPVDPLYGGGMWSAYSLDWSVQDYITSGTPRDRIILGLPLYGRSWNVSSHSLPAPSIGGSEAVVFSTAWTQAASNGAHYDAQSLTPYYDRSNAQIWYGDTDSVRERVRYAEAEELGGFGFWALHYTNTDPVFWGMIHTETVMLGDTDTDTDADADTDMDTDVDTDPLFSGELVANAGRPFLAYVGDTVILTAEASLVPEDATYRWTQVDGPEVTLSTPDAVETSFIVDAPGTHVFEIEVGDGTDWSAPDRTHVIVIDRNIGKAYRSCGWSPTPLAGWMVFLLVPWIRRRGR